MICLVSVTSASPSSKIVVILRHPPLVLITYELRSLLPVAGRMKLVARAHSRHVVRSRTISGVVVVERCIAASRMRAGGIVKLYVESAADISANSPPAVLSNWLSKNESPSVGVSHFFFWRPTPARRPSNDLRL